MNKEAKEDKEDTKLDPNSNELPSLEDLAKIDFSKKSDKIKETEALLQAAEAKMTAAQADPLYNVYIMMYKGGGPVESVLFRSNRPPHYIIRDCQIWCSERNYRFINHKRALVDILARASREELTGAPEGDITDLITRQSKDATLKAV